MCSHLKIVLAFQGLGNGEGKEVGEREEGVNLMILLVLVIFPK